MNSSLEPLSRAQERLRREGFTHDFELTDDAVVDTDTSTTHAPEDVKIVSVHRDEGISDPADEALLLAVRAPDGARGLLTTGYGLDVPHAEAVRRLGTGV